MRDWIAATTESIVTTDYCIDETLTLLLVRREAARAIQAGRELFERGMARIEFVSPDQVNRAWILFQQRASAGWSFTDCTSWITIGDLRISVAAALDEHFRQFGVQVVP
jgi:uncharacterized protein